LANRSVFGIERTIFGMDRIDAAIFADHMKANDASFRGVPDVNDDEDDEEEPQDDEEEDDEESEDEESEDEESEDEESEDEGEGYSE
jgi:hypothetical protein